VATPRTRWMRRCHLHTIICHVVDCMQLVAGGGGIGLSRLFGLFRLFGLSGLFRLDEERDRRVFGGRLRRDLASGGCLPTLSVGLSSASAERASLRPKS